MAITTGGVIGSFTPDNLIAKPYPPTDAFIVELETSGAYSRGTVLCLESDGTYSVIGASGTASAQTEKFDGDGEKISFTVAGKPAALTSVKVGGTTRTDYTYDAETGILTFDDAEEKFNGDGSTTEFTLTGSPSELKTVTVGGTAMEETTDYTYNSGNHKITFVTAPATGTDNIVVTYETPPASGTNNVEIKYNVTVLSGKPAAVLADDTASTDTTASAYRSGHFFRNKLIVNTGYVLTAADEDDLRRAGIFLSDGV